ncbi:MAG: ATP-binding protein, partial [Anaerolineales bacterium]|nr:ATP-binding protein [Anaerolineales bacterium]
PPPETNAPLGRFYMSGEQAMSLLQRPLGAAYELLDNETAAPYHQPLVDIEQQIAGLVSLAESSGTPTRLVRLALALGLDRFDLNVFLIALAPQLDGRFSKLYAFLQDDLTRKRPSVSLILDLLCPPTPERLLYLAHFSDDAPLLRHRLINLAAETGVAQPPLIDQAVFPDERIAAWLLLGQYQPPPDLKDALAYRPTPTPNIALLPEPQQLLLIKAAAGDDTLALVGRDRLSRETAVHLIAQQRQQSLLTLNLAADSSASPLDSIRLLLRDAQLINAIPHIAGWDAILKDKAPPPDLLKIVLAHPDQVVISGQKQWQLHRTARQRRLQWFRFPLPDTAQRARLLAHFLDGAVQNQSDRLALAGQFKLTSGQLRDLVETARDLAGQNGRNLQAADLFAAARAHSNPRLTTLARKIKSQYVWNDLILPGDQITLLHEMVNTIRSRPLVLEEWGIGKKLAAGAGITALFFGPPGTGKTMAAGIIAHELGLDLYKIDLSTMISKYIGETEKNLERIFTEAESSNAILFFDEADAIFGKRSEVKDAHDRYANIEISYLLQRMESYDGVTILATNLKANLDDAFTRRLQFAVDFPFPKAPDRLRIWQALLPPDVPHDPDLDMERMAEQFDIAGGNIRNILVNAAYLAATNGQVVTMEHLLHGTRRELQKMGRLVNERDLAISKGK